MTRGLDIINEVEDRLGWRQTDTLEGTLRPESRKLLRLLNRVLRALQRADDWPLLREDGDILTIAGLEGSDYFLLSNGNKLIRLGSGASGDLEFDDTFINRAIQIGSHETVYRIEEVTSGNAVKLNRPWLGDNSTGGLVGEELSYKIAQDQYALPEDFDRPTGKWQSFLAPYGVYPLGPEKFREQRIERGGKILVANPDYFTIYGTASDSDRYVLRLDPFPKYQQLLTFSYQRNHPEVRDDNDKVYFPLSYEDVVIEAMLYLANRDYEDDAKMQVVLRDYMRVLNGALGNPSVAEEMLQMTPDSRHRRAQRAKWGTGVRVNWGSLFDRADRVGFD